MEYDACLKIKSVLQDNECKVCEDLWKFCNKYLKGKLKARSYFESEIRNEPINLFKRIKDHSLSCEEYL